MIKRTYTPIAVAYKKKYGKKVIVEEFIHERCPDTLITKASNKLPKDCEILDIGVGKSFYGIYKKKYSK
jgi:hypothetical protein